MAETISIIKPSHTSGSRTMIFNKTYDWEPVETNVKTGVPGQVRSSWKDTSADARWEPTLVVQSTKAPNSAIRRSSVKLTTAAVVYNTDSEVIGYQPIEVTIAVNTPQLALNMADLNELVTAVLSCITNGSDPTYTYEPLLAVTRGVTDLSSYVV